MGKLAKAFGLKLAFDQAGIEKPQYLNPDMKAPTIQGRWRIYTL